MPHGERIAEYLLSIEAVKLRTDPPFTWNTGIQSPIYCDNRMIYSHPQAREFMVSALVSRVKNLHIPADVIAGTASAAIGWATLVADRLGLPMVYVSRKGKDYGAKKRIEGDLKPGQHVVLIEDLISTGNSSMSAVDALRDEGKAMVTDVVSIFSYEFALATQAARAHKIRLHPLSTITTLVNVALSQMIKAEEATIIDEFVKRVGG
jgi:orotate phosphoribosyltransferase